MSTIIDIMEAIKITGDVKNTYDVGDDEWKEVHGRSWIIPSSIGEGYKGLDGYFWYAYDGDSYSLKNPRPRRNHRFNQGKGKLLGIRKN